MFVCVCVMKSGSFLQSKDIRPVGRFEDVHVGVGCCRDSLTG